MVVNTEGKRQFKNYTQHSWETTTADNLKTELYSMDPQFKKHRWNLKIWGRAIFRTSATQIALRNFAWFYPNRAPNRDEFCDLTCHFDP